MTEEFYIVKIKIQLHSKQILLPFDESFSCKVPKRYVNYGREVISFLVGVCSGQWTSLK